MRQKKTTRIYRAGDTFGGIEVVESPDEQGSTQLFVGRRYLVRCLNCGHEKEISRTMMNQRLSARKERKYCSSCAPRSSENDHTAHQHTGFEPFYVPGWGLITHLGRMGPRWGAFSDER